MLLSFKSTKHLHKPVLPSVFRVSTSFHFFSVWFGSIKLITCSRDAVGGRRLAWTLCCASTGFMGRHMRMFGSVTTQDFYPFITMYTHPYLSFTFHLLLIYLSLLICIYILYLYTFLLSSFAGFLKPIVSRWPGAHRFEALRCRWQRRLFYILLLCMFRDVFVALFLMIFVLTMDLCVVFQKAQQRHFWHVPKFCAKRR